MTNPFIGEGENLKKHVKVALPDDYDSNIETTPLELTEEFETAVFPVQYANVKINPVLLLTNKEVPDYILHLPEGDSTYIKFRRGWQTLREDTRHKIEHMSVDELEIPDDTNSNFIKNLENDIINFQDFFMSNAHIKPALDSAVDSVSRMLERIAGTKVEVTSSGIARAMLTDVVNAKFLEFFADKLEIPEETISLLRCKYFQGEGVNNGRELSKLQALLKMLLSKQK